MEALDTATRAGAHYVDVHVRVTQRESIGYFQGPKYPPPAYSTQIGFGIRALVNGSWGFSGVDGVPTKTDVAQLGRDATAQAAIAARGSSQVIELAALPAVANGTWTMPVEIDPFTVSTEEKIDFVDGISEFFLRESLNLDTQAWIDFMKETRTFASSDGAYTTQTVYATGGFLRVDTPPDWASERRGYRQANFLSYAGAGWEHVLNAPLQDRAHNIIEEALRMRRSKPVEVGRYDMVFDAYAMAGILDESLGAATELDRAMGYIANTFGTSYLNDPLAMVGTLRVASPLVTVTMNRSMPRGAATVKWDAEGVAPVETTLVKDGIVTDFQTTRESANWLAPAYQHRGQPVRSNGCAGVYGTASPVTTYSPNFVMTPGTQALSFDDLIKDTKKGYAVIGAKDRPRTDQQALNGAGQGEVVYEITNGKLGSAVLGAEYLYRSPEFWKGVKAIGGAESACPSGLDRSRSDWHWQYKSWHTVSAVPTKVTGVAMIDAMKKA